MRDTMFTPVRFRRGYDMDEVDDALDELRTVGIAGQGLIGARTGIPP
ncbi:DivIVA domain-containing protein [Aeromicrobium sp. UC242_57]